MAEFDMTPPLPFSFYSRWLTLGSSMSTQSGKMALTMTWRSWCTSGSMAAGQSAVWHVEQVRTAALTVNPHQFRSGPRSQCKPLIAFCTHRSTGFHKGGPGAHGGNECADHGLKGEAVFLSSTLHIVFHERFCLKTGSRVFWKAKQKDLKKTTALVKDRRTTKASNLPEDIL